MISEKAYNVWHKEQGRWHTHNQESSNPWRYSLEEAIKEFEYLTESLVGSHSWIILEMDDNNNPIFESELNVTH